MLYFVSLPDFLSQVTCSVLDCCVVRPAKTVPCIFTGEKITGGVSERSRAAHASTRLKLNSSAFAAAAERRRNAYESGVN